MDTLKQTEVAKDEGGQGLSLVWWVSPSTPARNSSVVLQGITALVIYHLGRL